VRLELINVVLKLGYHAMLRRRIFLQSLRRSRQLVVCAWLATLAVVVVVGGVGRAVERE
jgi:hypothetical protein